MDQLRQIADRGIRRACGFVGLGVGTTMLALTFDMVLALRSGASLLAIACLAMVVAAWTAPRRDMRRTELWHALAGTPPHFARAMPRDQAQSLLAGVIRERLLWHAERVGAAALALWLAAALLWGLVWLLAGRP
jgi:hypothetical protein